MGLFDCLMSISKQEEIIINQCLQLLKDWLYYFIEKHPSVFISAFYKNDQSIDEFQK